MQLDLLDLILRWMHIFGAIMLVGSTIYMRCVYVPAKLQSGEEPGQAYSECQRTLWSRLVMIASAQLLFSGIVNLVLIVKANDFDKTEFYGISYHMLLGIKFLIAMVVLFLAAVIAGRSSLAQKLRQKERTWLTINMVLAIIVVCLAGVMRIVPRSPKSETSSTPVQQSIEQVVSPASAFPNREIS